MNHQATRSARPTERTKLPVPVPHIARWSGETERPSKLMIRRDRRGIAYTDERTYDRAHGVLWTRTPSQPGRGKPEFGAVHSLRQRLCMTGLRCQICGAPADRNNDGTLWLVDAATDELVPHAEQTTHPPVCLPCAQLSVRACPHLRPRWTALRVVSHTFHGVEGVLYAPGNPGEPELVAVDTGSFALTDPCVTWVRAHQLIAELQSFVVTDI